MAETPQLTDTEQLMLNIRKQLDELPDYGQLQFHIKRHAGKFSNTDAVKMTSVRFNGKEPNVDATARTFQLIKAVSEAKLTGTLTFSLNFKDGLAEQMMVQDFRKI